MESLRPQDPQWIGDYRLIGRLGTGGMGHVYLARSEGGRTVAVKLVKPELADEPEFRARFRQEVAAAQRVGGRWTAPVLDARTDAAVPWVATGYVAGPALSDTVERYGPLPDASLRTLAYGLACALLDIHGAGLIHRDLKPSNILVAIGGPRVIDFGIARALDSVAERTVTRTGMAVGSPAFMSPEQVTGGEVTAASDVFCLGTVLAYAATGTLPFGSPADNGVHAVMFRIAQNEPELDLPDGPVRDLITACLAKDPAARPGPEELAAMAGPVSGGGAESPWLPAAIIAELGAHAVRLLDTDTPPGGVGSGPDTGEVSHGGTGPPRRTLVGVRPLEAAEEYAYAAPAPRRRRGRGRVAVFAVAGALVLTGIGAVGAMALKDDTEKAAAPPSDVPKGFVGTWTGEVERMGDANGGVRRFTITSGRKGEVVAGSITLGEHVECKSDGVLVGTADMTLVLRAKVRASTPEDRCTALGQHTLKLYPDGALQWSAAGRTATLHRVRPQDERLAPGLLGDWRRPFAGGTQFMHIGRVAPGDQAVTLTSDIDGVHCEARADLIAAGPTHITVGPSAVTRGGPPHCVPGAPTTIEIAGDTLVRRPYMNSRARTYTYTRG